ncbi:MAG TPA: hypothetical protein VF950_09460 [Planctomycetota bacterium]
MRVALALVGASTFGVLAALAWFERPVGPPPELALEAAYYWKEVPVGRPLDVSFHLRNRSNGPATVQFGQAPGYRLWVILLDPSGKPVLNVGCGGPLDEPEPPTTEDFETLPAGGASRALRRANRLPAPRTRGRHVLQFRYLREAPEFPTLWERMSGEEAPTADAARLMRQAWQGDLSGEIDVDVY